MLALLDRFTELTGRTVAWLTAAMAVLTVLVVVLRYAFGEGAIALQESITYLHGIVLMLGMAYALKHDAHVRVDLIYSRLSPRGQSLVNLLGHCLFLIPVAATLLWSSLPYVRASWRILEGSSEVGGLPAVFLLKTLIPIMAALLLLQALAEIVRQLARLHSARQN